MMHSLVKCSIICIEHGTYIVDDLLKALVNLLLNGESLVNGSVLC